MGYDEPTPELHSNTDTPSAQDSLEGKSSTPEAGSNIDPLSGQDSSPQDGDEDKSSTSEVDSNIDTSSAQVGPNGNSPTIEKLIQKWSEDPPVLIAVMGCTGSGKTTFVNKVSGSLLEIGHDLDSCTLETQVSEEFELDGKRVVLIDTPGFGATDMEGVDVLRSIAGPLGKMYSAGVKLNGVIYVHRISDDVFGSSAFSDFRIFKKLCGKDALKNVVLVTNMWGRVTIPQGKAREQQLKDNYFKSALAKGAKLLRYDDTLESAHEILRKILENKRVVLKIQTELIDKRMKDVDRTEAGMEVNREIHEALGKFRKEIKDVDKSMKKATKRNDEESRQELEEEKQRIREEVEQLKEALPNQPSKVKRTKGTLTSFVPGSRAKETLTSFVPGLRAQKPPSHPVETPAEKAMESAGRGEGGDVKQDAKEGYQRPAEIAPSQFNGTSTGITPPVIVQEPPINQPSVLEDGFEEIGPARASGSKHSLDKATGAVRKLGKGLKSSFAKSTS